MYYTVSFAYQNTCSGETTSFKVSDSLSIDSVRWIVSDITGAIHTLFSNNYTSKYTFAGASQFQVTMEAYSNGRKDEVSKIVTINKPPVFDLGNDTIICPGSVIKLGIFSNGASVHWSTGSSADTILIPSPGKYWVEAWNGQCKKSDTITIYNPTPSGIRIPTDTNICEGNMWQVNLNLPASRFVWQDGTRSSKYTINKPGTYWVRVSNPCSIFADTIQVKYLHKPEINLGKDTVLCQGSAFYLRLPDQAASYRWQDGSTEPAYVVSGPGTYWVEGVNHCFKASDTLIVKQLLAPIVHLGNDTTICMNDSIILNAKWQNSKYLWQDNSTHASYTVKGAGVYSVIAQNNCGYAKSSISVQSQDCNCYLYAPRIFSPNSDGLNDTWQPSACGTLKYNLIIYNRWGERVFESNEIQIGWDGKIKGTPAMEGQYLYTLFTQGLDKKEYHKTGSFYLIRPIAK
jgi:gliding motility-associated-like protein